ncbi:hypothetical protein ACFX2B_012492 [Malus domestica]
MKKWSSWYTQEVVEFAIGCHRGAATAGAALGEGVDDDGCVVAQPCEGTVEEEENASERSWLLQSWWLLQSSWRETCWRHG